MNMKEGNFRPEKRDPEQEFKQAFGQLQEIITVLSEMGMRIPEYCHSEKFVKKQWDAKLDFPIARDGSDGIRISRSKTGGFKVWFTNGFENADNEKRKEITEKLREKGFDVV